MICGCVRGVPQNDFDRLSAANQKLADENQELADENQKLADENQRLTEELNIVKAEAEYATEKNSEMVYAKLTGGFVATVRHIIPNYVLDLMPRVAIVTMFQDSPFMLGSANLDEETVAKLEIGQTYYFEIEDTPTGEIPIEELYTDYLFGQDRYPPFIITSIRPAEEDETGINGPSVTYQKIN